MLFFGCCITSGCFSPLYTAVFGFHVCGPGFAGVARDVFMHSSGRWD